MDFTLDGDGELTLILFGEDHGGGETHGVGTTGDLTIMVYIALLIGCGDLDHGDSDHIVTGYAAGDTALTEEALDIMVEEAFTHTEEQQTDLSLTNTTTGEEQQDVLQTTSIILAHTILEEQFILLETTAQVPEDRLTYIETEILQHVAIPEQGLRIQEQDLQIHDLELESQEETLETPTHGLEAIIRVHALM